jgi:hypothetical protein
MERQAGLGRSLEDVLDSLAPVEPDPAAPGRVLFEPKDLDQHLEDRFDQLLAEVRDLRGQVQHLVGLVPDDSRLSVVPDVPDATATGTSKQSKKTKKLKQTKKHDKKAKRAKKHDA